MALAILQARRLTRPLEELASAADRLGVGDARPLGRRYGVAELDRLAEGLDGSARRITDLLSAERDFAADASHQLRTPLTALSMRLEEMIAAAGDPEVVREEGAAALAQTERLAEVVSQLLGRTRRAARGVPSLLAIDDVSPSRSSSGTRRSAGPTASWRWRGRRACPPTSRRGR